MKLTEKPNVLLYYNCLYLQNSDSEFGLSDQWHVQSAHETCNSIGKNAFLVCHYCHMNLICSVITLSRLVRGDWPMKGRFIGFHMMSRIDLIRYKIWKLFILSESGGSSSGFPYLTFSLCKIWWSPMERLEKHLPLDKNLFYILDKVEDIILIYMLIASATGSLWIEGSPYL